MEIDCKHVAAVLIEARQRELLSGGGEAASERRPSDAGQHPLFPPKVTAPAAKALLPPDVVAWIESLGAEEVGDDYPPDMAQRLIYVLAPHAHKNETPVLSVLPKSVRLLKSGAFADKAGNVNPMGVVNSPAPAEYLRRSDFRSFAPWRIPASRMAGRSGWTAATVRPSSLIS